MIDISQFPWASRRIVENRRQFIGRTLGLQRRKRSNNVHSYEFEFTSIEMTPDVGRSVKAKLSDAHDQTIIWVDPVYSFTRGIAPSGGLFLNNNVAQGQREFSIVSAQNYQLLAGDYLQIGSDTKVYELANDVPAGSGTKNIRLTHPLRQSANQNDPVIIDNVTWHLISDSVIEIETDADNNQDIEIVLNAVEDL